MLLTTILHHYLLWHYSRAFHDLVHVWGNLLWFVAHFFSIPQLTRSLLAPYKRIVEPRGETWNLEDLAGYVIIGLISRILGFLLRSVIIVVGLIVLGVLAVLGIITFLFWIIAPIALLAGILFGLRLLFVF